MIYTIKEIQNKVKQIAEQYDILKIWLFGSYFKGTATESSDVDLLVKYGTDCDGLHRIEFMLDLESKLQKDVDVINIDFTPEFITAKGELIYEQGK